MERQTQCPDSVGCSYWSSSTKDDSVQRGYWTEYKARIRNDHAFHIRITNPTQWQSTLDQADFELCTVNGYSHRRPNSTTSGIEIRKTRPTVLFQLELTASNFESRRRQDQRSFTAERWRLGRVTAQAASPTRSNLPPKQNSFGPI